jgi:hypothetical protein
MIGQRNVQTITQNSRLPSVVGALLAAVCGPSLKRWRWVKLSVPKQAPKSKNSQMYVFIHVVSAGCQRKCTPEPLICDDVSRNSVRV